MRSLFTALPLVPLVALQAADDPAPRPNILWLVGENISQKVRSINRTNGPR
jgi:hypothetical protein